VLHPEILHIWAHVVQLIGKSPAQISRPVNKDMRYWTSYAGLTAMVAVLYGLRIVAYGSGSKIHSIATVMGIGLIIALPGVWFFSTQSSLRPQPFIGTWLFPPVCWLTVLTASCLLDFWRRRCDLRHWYIRFPCEIIIGIPVWAFIWSWICIFCNWIWLE
jgi:hypothetical protein